MIEFFMKPETGRLDAGGAWIAFTTEGGDWRLSPVGWVGIICSQPPTISFRLYGRESGEAELLPGSSFAICLAPFADPAIQDQGDPKVEEVAEVALIAACPVRIECRNASFDSDRRLGMVSGEVLTVHIGGVSYGLAEENPFESIRTFARTWRRQLQPVAPSGGGPLDMGALECK
jgi:flavin reductase (DIM6/NTAB) family NADH-FMN oxidoreductase RutF